MVVARIPATSVTRRADEETKALESKRMRSNFTSTQTETTAHL